DLTRPLGEPALERARARTARAEPRDLHVLPLDHQLSTRGGAHDFVADLAVRADAEVIPVRRDLREVGRAREVVDEVDRDPGVPQPDQTVRVGRELRIAGADEPEVEPDR